MEKNKDLGDLVGRSPSKKPKQKTARYFYSQAVYENTMLGFSSPYSQRFFY